MRRSMLALFVLTAVVIVGVVVSRVRGGPADKLPATTSPSIAGGVTADDVVRVATNPAVDVVAAREAAVEAVASTGTVFAAGPLTRRDLVMGFSSRSYGPTLAAQTSESVQSLQLELGVHELDPSKFVVAEQPMTAVAELLDDGRVTVRVWSALLIVLPGTGPGRVAWRTVTLVMVIEDQRWLIDSWSTSPGPTPAPPAEGVFDSGESVAEVMRWPSATRAASSVGG